MDYMKVIISMLIVEKWYKAVLKDARLNLLRVHIYDNYQLQAHLRYNIKQISELFPVSISRNYRLSISKIPVNLFHILAVPNGTSYSLQE